MTIIAIDLGTTNSLVSVFTDDGPVLIPNTMGDILTPSVVGLTDKGELIVGQAARDRLVTHPSKTVARFKRYMGSNRDFRLARKTYRAEELSAMVLRSLKSDAESYLGHSVERAIISVPAYFNDIQRKATYAAGKMAGLTIERLINEPTAAALAYGLNSKEDENTFLVVDLGGGTFDVSILEIFDGIMEVRSSAGDAFLGGEDFTDAIVAHFGQQLGADMALDDKKKGLLRDLANKAKLQLSTAHEARVKFKGAAANEQTTLTITRTDFETICEKLVKRMRQPISRAIMDAGLRAENIDRVVLVGGATRMPVIRAMVTRLLKLFPEHNLDPDHVVGLGAAVQAGLVGRHAALEDVVMTDVCPFTLGTNVSVQVGPDMYEGGHFQPIIERNTVIPVSRVVRNSALQKGQNEINLSIYQGESPRVVDNVLLGHLKVSIPVNKDSHEDIDIRFTYDVSGVLEVLVTIISTNQTKRLIIEGNPGSLSAAEIEKRFKSLENIKVHPRDGTENTALVARLERAYENQLGDVRQIIGMRLTEFQATMDRQNETDISLSRKEISAWLEDIENMDVF